MPTKYVRETFPDFELPRYRGERYESMVPDTLDLQERAALAVNGLTEPTDPEFDYEAYWWTTFGTKPPSMEHWYADHFQPKALQSLPLARLMSGSTQNSHVERRWLEAALLSQGEDGLYYTIPDGRPWMTELDHSSSWCTPLPRGAYTAMHASGMFLGGMAAYYMFTGDVVWKRATERAVDGLARLATDEGDYAWYPKHNYGLGEEPPRGIEPDALNYMSTWEALFSAVKAYRATGYEPARDLAGKLARFYIHHSPAATADGGFTEQWPGIVHVPLNLISRLAVLEYAILTGDAGMSEWARRGYEFCRANSEPLSGYVPESIFYGPCSRPGWMESCDVAMMVDMAVKMSLAGIGDYWDDADRWVRNMLAEGQLRHVDWVYRLQQNKPETKIAPNSTTDRVPERNIGAWGTAIGANDFYMGRWKEALVYCCTVEASHALYLVWNNTLRHEGGKLRINLLLNRASPWADVDSHIPYVGQVDVRIKQPVELSLRIPEWTKPEECRVEVSGVVREPSWEGRYAVVGAVKPGDVATLTFPIRERSDLVYIEKTPYTLLRKGNEVVGIDPPGVNCPLYQRAHYRENSTRWRKIERFVADKRIEF